MEKREHSPFWMISIIGKYHLFSFDINGNNFVELLPPHHLLACVAFVRDEDSSSGLVTIQKPL